MNRYFLSTQYTEAEEYFYEQVALYPDYIGFFWVKTSKQYFVSIQVPFAGTHLEIIKIHGRI